MLFSSLPAGILQTLKGLHRELAIYRHKEFAARTRHANTKFNTLVAALEPAIIILYILLGRQEVLDDRLKLHFAESTTGLHVCQDTFQVPYPGRKVLHVAEALVDGFQALGHRLEALGQAFFQALAEGLDVGEVTLAYDVHGQPGANPYRSCS